jgi:monooxygenase
MATEHVDVLIVGAGLSGIGAACHLVRDLPDTSYTILEARDAIGGTWDLFNYPGIRSDSDMHTLGYRFRPWPESRILADGPSIKKYVEETAAEYGVDEQIRFGHKVISSDWDSQSAQWTVTFDQDGKRGQVTANFLWNCSGYYSYDEPHRPAFPGEERFQGEIIHPQMWPEDLDYAGKKVVVIGSGATAITLVPSMAGTAEHVTMLQRTPTYVLSVPGKDPVDSTLKKILPDDLVSYAARWRNVGLQAALYQASKRQPALVKRGIRASQQAQLPKDYDVDPHFAPPYNPWDQRLCVVPDGDLFRAIRRGDASIETGHIDTFTETGIRLQDGTEIEADIIVTATGLTLLAFGGAAMKVDGEDLKLGDHVAYKGLMLDGVPNFAFVIGYSNASWTLKADLVSEYVVRLLKRMQKEGSRTVVPVKPEDVETKPIMDLASGYISRAEGNFPMQGDRGPWKSPANYFRDLVVLRHRPLTDKSLEFSA